MTRLLTALCLIVAATLHAQVPARGQTSITGRVVADATDEAVPRAHVIAYGTTTRVISITSTDADGQFRFPPLPEDRYRIGVSKAPYVSAIAEASASPAAFRLVSGAAIAGQVVTALGRPKRDVVIVVRTSTGAEAGRATTDSRGLYRVYGLAAGDYIVAPDGAGLAAPLTLAVGEDRPQLHFTLPPTEAEPPVQTKPGTGRITGRVVSTLDGGTLSGVTVLLTGGATATAETGGSGTFEFNQLPAGSYTLRLKEGAVAPQGSVVVEVAGAPVTNVVLRGLSLGSISGAVHDDRGEPIIGAPVSAYLRSQVTETPFLLARTGAQTDDRGSYRIDELPPGDYLVCACSGRVPRLDPSMLRRLIGQSPQPAQLLPFMDANAAFTQASYYPGRARAADALFVSLTQADHRLGIDITVPTSRTHTVFGQLVPQGPVGIEGTTVRLVVAGDLPEAITFTEMAPRRLAPDGRFSIPGVPPGTYALIAYPPKKIGANKIGATGMTLVTVEDRDVSGVTVLLSPGGRVRGRVAFAPGATPPSSAQLEKGRINLTSADGHDLMLVRMSDPTGTLDLQASVKADGSFELDDVPPGRYRLRTGGFPLPWFSIESVTTSHGTALDHEFTIDSGVQTDVTLTMSPVPPATLEGSVTLGKDELPRSVRIVLFAADWRARPQFFKIMSGFASQYVDADGTFRFQTVPAGEYFLVAATQSDFQFTEVRLSQWERTATRVTLRAGETTKTALKR